MNNTYPIFLGFPELGLLDAQTVTLTATDLVGELRLSPLRQDWVGSVGLREGILILIALAWRDWKLNWHGTPGRLGYLSVIFQKLWHFEWSW
jgi:hypothetical protein